MSAGYRRSLSEYGRHIVLCGLLVHGFDALDFLFSPLRRVWNVLVLADGEGDHGTPVSVGCRAGLYGQSVECRGQVGRASMWFRSGSSGTTEGRVFCMTLCTRTVDGEEDLASRLTDEKR